MNPEHALLAPNRSLMEQLREHGFLCDLQEISSPSWGPGQGRIVCNRRAPGDRGESLGDGTACFWMYRDGSILFLGLWSGKLYEVPWIDQTLELAEEILKNTKGTPWGLPPELVTRFGLRICEELTVLPASATEDLQEALKESSSRGFSLRDFVEAVGPAVDFCVVEPDGLVRFRKGRAAAFARLDGGWDYVHRSVTVLFHEGLTETEDHVALLQALQARLNASLFDPAWGNRIHLDDPYYAPSGVGEQPEMPRNAPCADAPPQEE
jgi:hypothetical protein